MEAELGHPGELRERRPIGRELAGGQGGGVVPGRGVGPLGPEPDRLPVERPGLRGVSREQRVVAQLDVVLPEGLAHRLGGGAFALLVRGEGHGRQPEPPFQGLAVGVAHGGGVAEQLEVHVAQLAVDGRPVPEDDLVVRILLGHRLDEPPARQVVLQGLLGPAQVALDVAHLLGGDDPGAGDQRGVRGAVDDLGQALEGVLQEVLAEFLLGALVADPELDVADEVVERLDGEVALLIGHLRVPGRDLHVLVGLPARLLGLAFLLLGHVPGRDGGPALLLGLGLLAARSGRPRRSSRR